MKSINEVMNNKNTPTEYVQPKKDEIKKGQFSNLCSADREYFNGFVERCKRCKGYEQCENYASWSEDGKHHYMDVPKLQIPRIVEVNGRTEIYCDYCKEWYMRNSKGTKQGTYEIETPTIQYENEQSKIANRLFSNMKGYLFGETGTGKTTMMKMLTSKFINNGKNVLIESAFNISKDVKDGFEKATLDKYQHVDILIIDDLFREQVTAYKVLEIMTPIIQYRVDNNKPLLITSNYNIAQIKNLMMQVKVDETTADTMCSRIRMLGVYELQGQDHRVLPDL